MTLRVERDMSLEEASDNSHASDKPRYTKVRTGCTICKGRRVKCDETKPFCRRCTTTGRHCTGYTPPPPPKIRVRRSKYALDGEVDLTTTRSSSPHGKPYNEITSSQLATPIREEPRFLSSWTSPQWFSAPFEEDYERRSFHYFRTRVSHEIASFFEVEFWQYLVLQATLVEPAVRHALLALSSVYEINEVSHESQSPSDNRISGLTKFAMHHYNLAVKCLSYGIGTTILQPRLVLMSCFIFIWLEVLRDNIDVALDHLRAGLNILNEQQYHSHHDSITETLGRLFTRLHTQAALHGSPTTDFNATLRKDKACIKTDTLISFNSIFEARTSLDRILNNTICYHRQIEQPGYLQQNIKLFPYPSPFSVEAVCQSHLQSLTLWNKAFQSLGRLTSLEPKSTTALHEMELQSLFASNTLSVLFSRSEMVYDTYTADFERMIDLVCSILATNIKSQPEQKPSFRDTLPFNTGILPPLFYVILKCRDRRVRTEAIRLLHQCPQREGMWERDALLEFCEWKVRKEESGRLADTEILPESARIYAEKAREMVIDGAQVTMVRFKRRGDIRGLGEDDDGPYEEPTSLSMRLAGVVGT